MHAIPDRGIARAPRGREGDAVPQQAPGGAVDVAAQQVPGLEGGGGEEARAVGVVDDDGEAVPSAAVL